MSLLTAAELPIAQYHASAPAWLSKTSLRDFIHHGPAWWKLAYLDKSIDRKRPDGAIQGAALDCYLTEGAEAFAAGWAIRPYGMDGRTKAGKEWADANTGKEVLSYADSLILPDAVAAVRSHPRWPEIQACAAQMTCRRQSSGLGLGLQSRPDWLNTGNGCLFDLKKTCDLDAFGRQAINLGYHLQAAIAGWCLAGDGIQLEHAYLVAVEWERGARCRVYEIQHYAMEAGDRQMRATAAEIARRIQTDDWTDRQEGAQELEVPEWMQRQMEAAA